MNKIFRRLFLFLGCGVVLFGCTISAQKACMDAWQEEDRDLTEEDKLALFYGAKGKGCIYEWFFTLDQGGIPQIAYPKIRLDKVLEVDAKQLKDLEGMLDPKNEDWYKFLKETDLRPYLESQERALKFRVSRLKLVLNHSEFRKLMGETSRDASGEDTKSGYDVRIFLPEFNPAKDTPFKAKYIDEAKRSGKLVLIGKTIVFDYEFFGKKEPDAESPQDPNRFSWKPKSEGLEINLYKIVDSPRPINNSASYLEATRINYHFDHDGQITSVHREPKPALRIFTSYSEKLDIVVLDTDREGELGFGYPDIVEKLFVGIDSGKNFYLQNQPLLARLFEERTQEKRKLPDFPKEQKFSYVDAGTPVDTWEKSSHLQGWYVPLEYKNENGDNYHLEIVFSAHKSEGHSSALEQIAYIKKYYHAPGNAGQSVKGEVVEYYRPLSEFARRNIVEARIDYANRKRVIIEREGYPGISGIITPGKNIFMEDKPFRTDYTEGETRWRLEDRDKTGKFGYRTEISKSNSSNSLIDSNEY